MQAIQQEQVRSEAAREAAKDSIGMPFRFFTSVGETKEIVVIDDAPSFARWEHCQKDPRTGRYDVYLPCIDENANCPVCAKAADRPAYFAMYLTVIDLTPYENRDGEEVPFSKKLLVVKPMQQKKILRFYEKHKSLRGMVLEMTRDSKKDAGIGDPAFVEFIEEDDLLTYETSYVDKDGKEHDVICHEVFDYEALFPPKTEDELSALVGGGGRNGSRGADDRALGRGRGRGDDDGEAGGDAWQGAAPRRVASRRGAPADEVEELPPEEVADAPRRGAPIARAPAARAPAARAPAARQAPAPAARPAPRRAAATIDPDDMPDAGADEGPPFDVDPPQRRAAPARRPAPEPEAAAPRANMAARRAQLRR